MPESSFGACPYMELEGNHSIRIDECIEILSYDEIEGNDGNHRRTRVDDELIRRRNDKTDGSNKQYFAVGRAVMKRKDLLICCFSEY